MTFFAIEQPPFHFGGPELILTGLAVGIVMALLGPRWLKQRRALSQKRDPLDRDQG
jgi:hypothetical protein